MPCRASISIIDDFEGWHPEQEVYIINCNQQNDHTGPHTAYWFEALVRWTQ